MKSNVAVINFPQGGRMDKESLSVSLQSLPWRLRAQSVFDLLGYGETASLHEGSYSAKNSQSYLLGCQNLREICDTLALSIEEVLKETRALHLSSRLSVSGEQPSDILSNYDQVVSILGREPVSASEVTEAISFVKDTQISDLNKAKDTLEEKLSVGERRIAYLEETITEKDARITQLRSELEDRIESLRLESAELKERHELEKKEIAQAHQARLDQARGDLRRLLESEFEEALQDTTQKYHERIERLTEEKQEAINHLEAIIANEMVPREEFVRINLENEQVRQLNQDNLVKISALSDKIELLSDGAALQQKINHLNQKLKKLTKAYRLVESKRAAFEERIQRLEEDHLVEMDAAITQARQEASQDTAGRGLPLLLLSIVSASTMVAGYHFLF